MLEKKPSSVHTFSTKNPITLEPVDFNHEMHLRDIDGELDILAGEVFEAEDVFFHSFARL